MTLACQHFVENVIVPLFRRVAHDSGLLQEVLGHVGPSDDAPVELDLHELAEPRRVVVPKCLGVSEALDNRWRLMDLLSDLGREMETNSLFFFFFVGCAISRCLSTTPHPMNRAGGSILLVHYSMIILRPAIFCFNDCCEVRSHSYLPLPICIRIHPGIIIVVSSW